MSKTEALSNNNSCTNNKIRLKENYAMSTDWFSSDQLNLHAVRAIAHIIYQDILKFQLKNILY